MRFSKVVAIMVSLSQVLSVTAHAGLYEQKQAEIKAFLCKSHPEEEASRGATSGGEQGACTVDGDDDDTEERKTWRLQRRKVALLRRQKPGRLVPQDN